MSFEIKSIAEITNVILAYQVRKGFMCWKLWNLDHY